MHGTATSSQPAAVIDAWRPGRRRRAVLFLVALWAGLYLTSCFSPGILDDADGTHSNAARQMLLSHDWVTLRVNNVRYLEKAAMPYWIAAASFKVFGLNAFAAHVPEAVAVLGLALLGFVWAGEVYGARAGFYAGLFTLTSAGVFLFTRIFLPDPLLSFLLAVALYCFLKCLERGGQIVSEAGGALRGAIRAGEGRETGTARGYAYALWAALALGVMAKGLVALVFFFGPAMLYLALRGEYRAWRRLRPFTGAVLFLAIAAPWHILAGLRNTQGMNGHGFFWFYFVNEHFLRFLGRRIPRDYNKLPGYLYWSLHVVWLFPWSLFLPLGIASFYARWKQSGQSNGTRASGPGNWLVVRIRRFSRTTLLLVLYIAFVLLFFSFSTNQEYYTFPAYLPMLMLLAAAVAGGEAAATGTRESVRIPGGSPEVAAQESRVASLLTLAHAALTVLGMLIAAALAYGLWTSRNLPFVPDIGSLLAHRGVGDYTLSMSSLFDLTGPSFAALREPAALALAAFLVGPAFAWGLRRRGRHLAATVAVALTAGTFLVAAHLALVRFAPMLSSEDMAQTILSLEHTGQIAPYPDVLLFGDQAYGSSLGFYLNRPLDKPIRLVDGRSSSMLFGSYFPDAGGLFLTPAELATRWGHGPRKILFVPIERRTDAERLLAPNHPVLLKETSGKLLLTDRPIVR